MDNACFSMVYTFVESWQLSGNYRIGELNYREKLPDLPDVERKDIENKGFIVKMNYRILPD
ncbi:hypothetical protein [Algoriphagus persicinus]|uniref:hypothetical protein n=1 Tax=Algoriphagus persicinus TaxID=3108754 RepID=UPI002B38DEAA|nr:hypothetical protein [Algoriphagus sp. E1-3-M2]MEB2787161.1 hypothetical protein [Algoriphagus sp. E1-3-M2]